MASSSEAGGLRGRLRGTLQWRLFGVFALLAVALAACFVAFQSERERAFKVELLQERLLTINRQVVRSLGAGRPLPVLPRDVRLTLVGPDGRVTYDNLSDTLAGAYHGDRPEVRQALAGPGAVGAAVERQSATDGGREYFYCSLGVAPSGPDSIRVVRTALPYTLTLSERLRPDYTFFWLMLAVTVAVVLVGLWMALRLGGTLGRLNSFAERAERGERVYADEAFPRDELGSIASHIVRLYAAQQQAASEAEQAHRATLAQQQDKERLKRQLTNNINHELKTPVAAISGCLETLAAHPDIDADRRDDFLRRARAQCDRLVELLADVATLTRIEDGGASGAVDVGRTLDLAQVAAGALADVREALADKGSGVAPELCIPPGTLVRGNAELLASVLRNLLANALLHSGGSRVTVTASPAAAGGRILVEVADNGRGVPQEHLQHIFERFYRVDTGRRRCAGGTGLGLAIVKNAVILHGGTVKAANGPLGGLTVAFDLPAAH